MTRGYRIIRVKQIAALVLVFACVATLRKLGSRALLWYGWGNEYTDTVLNFYTALSQKMSVVHSPRWKELMLDAAHINISQAERMMLHLSPTLHSYKWADLDLTNFPEFEFLPNFKNPCWRESYIPPVTCPIAPNYKRNMTSIPRSKMSLRCLPYFLIIGQPKCGTTDIYRRLNMHPEVTLPGPKESFWMERIRFRPNCSSINTYLDYQQRSANSIDRVFRKGAAGEVYHHVITGDGSVDVMWDNTFWPMLPGNEGCREPCVTNADMVHHLNPRASIIISLRNPIDRLYSDYLYEAQWLHYGISKLDFHQEVEQEIREFNACLLTNSVRGCAYTGSHENAYSSKVRLRQGLYSVHVSDWLRVFPRQQLHIIKFEEYMLDIENHMKSLFRFLDLRELTKSEMTPILELKRSNTRKAAAQRVGEMLAETRQLLTYFYGRYNKELANILSDTKYLWD
ncbi:carbohydrate sulfotransferase 15-like [Haliotis rubra]|uniref:carbohydrate sulfotransferase 15-like n=1 Tax=Haliotis rubra TaxID=36100 RepID=UPI001EE60C36|nr:carbohydrate sulfotransferase 15-like [Haliotis rubra]